MKAKYLSAVLILFTVCSCIFSQVNPGWSVRYNGTGNSYDESTSIAVDPQGNVYVTGGSTGNGSGLDFYTVKYSPNGNMIWGQRYNGPANGDDDAYMIKLDAQNNVYVSGASTGIGSDYDYCIIKYNSAGVQQWAARYNGPANGDDEIYSVGIDASGNVYVTGYSTGTSSMADYCTIKYNSAGSEQWVRRFNGSGNNDDYGNGLAIDNSGNIYVTGASTSAATDLDYLTIKYNPNGDSLWVRTYNGPANSIDESISCITDGAGNLYIVGFSRGINTQEDYCTIKYNSSGVQQWAARYNGTGNGIDNAYSVALDRFGNVLITGNSAGISTGDDYCTIKYNSDGVHHWTARYDGNGSDDYANWFAVDAAGNVYVTGSINIGGINDDFATVKYNPAGGQEWAIRYNGTGNEYDNANCMAIDSTGKIYVTGGSDSPNNTDYFTIQYIQVIGIEPISTEAPKSFSLSQNYPNPFNPATKINFGVPIRSFAEIIIYNSLGQEITQIVNQELAPGIYSVDWNASNYPSGVYFYRLTAGDYSETKKMILMK